MKVIVKICNCGYQHQYIGVPVPKGMEDEVCGKCGGPLHVVKPGELGKLKVKVVTQILCPACGFTSPARRGARADAAVCKHCGYKNTEEVK